MDYLFLTMRLTWSSAHRLLCSDKSVPTAFSLLSSSGSNLLTSSRPMQRSALDLRTPRDSGVLEHRGAWVSRGVEDQIKWLFPFPRDQILQCRRQLVKFPWSWPLKSTSRFEGWCQLHSACTLTSVYLASKCIFGICTKPVLSSCLTCKITAHLFYSSLQKEIFTTYKRRESCRESQGI